MMGLANPYFLIGTVAAAVPLLIFLLTRDKVRKVAFPTLRFFAGASHTLLKRKRWQEMLLLAMRMAICALLAISFARPLLKRRDAAEGGPTEAAHAVAVVVDVSASMGQGGAFDQARKVVGKALDELPADTALALIAFDRVPRVEAGWTRDVAAVQGRIAAIAPGAGGTDIAAAIRKADESLTGITSADKQILLVSDLQRSGWEGFSGNYRLHPGVKLDIRPVKADETATVALVAADYPQSLASDAAQHAITVRIANFSSQPIRDLPIRLRLNDADHETQKVNLAAGENVVVRFRPKFDRVGDNRGVVEIGEKNAAGPGSTLYFNTRVVPKIEVRVLTADRPGVPGGGDTHQRATEFFLRTALAPPGAESPFAVKCLLAAATSAADLAPAAVVILADVDSVGAEVQKGLSAVLRRGGGLLFLPGPGVKPEAFAQSFGDLAPCQLRRVVAAGETRRGSAKAVLAKINYEHPIFEIFEQPHFGDFSAVRFGRYWEVTGSQLAKVPARYDDGRPFLVERAIGGGPGQWGRAVLLTSSVDTRWNNLADRAIFLPFFHKITDYLAQRAEPGTGYQVGDLLPLPLQHTLRDPSGQIHEGGAPGGAPGTPGRGGLAAQQCGFYELLDAGGNAVFSYAVNSDLAETNPATVDVAEIQAALEPSTSGATEEQAGLAGLGGESDRELWAYFVAALLLLTVFELFVANRVARH